MVGMMYTAFLVMFYWAHKVAADTSTECSSSQAVVNGRFTCLNDCDEYHLTSPYAHYCLGYFPNDGECYLKPYLREDIMTCNQKFSETDTPHWLVFLGGSNNYFMLKTVLDGLLELPFNTTFDPAKNWNATNVQDSEVATMDFIWDAQHNRLHSTVYYFQRDVCYYCLPTRIEEIFLGVPKATMGSFRISYVNLHYAADFPARFDLLVPPNSDWLSQNPALDVYMEWTGFWGDNGIPWTDHAANLEYLEHRRNNESINIRSFTLTDSAEDCNSGAYGNVDQVKLAFQNTETSFPKYTFSKRDMMYDQFQLSGNCMSNGHTFEPLNQVFANRYFNIICNDAEPSTVYEALIPVCVDLTGYEDQCFWNPSYQLLDNLEYVCPMTYKYVANVAPSDYCSATLLDKADSAPLPVCPALAAVPSIVVVVPKSIHDHDIQEYGFNIFVYVISALCFVFLVLESIRGIKLPPGMIKSKRSVKPSMDDLINGPRSGRQSPTTDRNEATAPNESGWFEPDVENSPQPGSSAREEINNNASLSEIEMLDIEGGEENGAVVPDAALVPSEGFSYRDTGFSAAQSEKVPQSPTPPSDLGASSERSLVTPAASPLSPSPIAEKSQVTPAEEGYFTNFGAKFAVWCSWPDPHPDRFEGIGFARYLASVHIVLGHMYQGGHLGTFHNFNKFGYTWVPWFFMLSGFILTFTERKKVAKLTRVAEVEGGVAAAAFSAKSTASIFEYVNHRLETLYPIYLVGICAAIATVWAIKGARALPPPGDVLIYFLLLQSWVPSILEEGLVYLVQCWFLSCLLFYWFVFHKIFAFLQSLSNIGLISVAVVCSVLLPLLYEMITFTFYEWSNAHNYLSIHRGVDVAVVVLKFHPLSYLHLFTLGCCLPRIREMLAATSSLSFTFPFFVFVSYGFLTAIYLTVGDEVPGYGLSFRLGLVSILQCTLLLGLCQSKDVLGRLFCHPLLKQFGLYGYPQYIFQFIVLGWFSYATGKNLVDIRYFLLLFSTSVISWTLVSPFNGSKRMNTFVQCLIPFLVAYTMLQPFWSTYHLPNGTTTTTTATSSTAVVSSAGVVPPSAAFRNVTVPEWWSDALMSVAVTNNELLEGYSAEWRIFNPSILQSTSHTYMVARRDYQVGAGYSWFDTDYLLNKWESQILVGIYNKKAATHKTLVTRSRAFMPCMPPTTCNGNGTLSVKKSTGPEDPRLFYFDNSFYISVFSYDNIAVNGSIVGVGGDFGTDSRLCVPSSDGLIGRMYVAKIGTVQVNPCLIHDFVPVVQTGLAFDDYSIVKNWLAFTHTVEKEDNTTTDALYFIHQISPRFIIMRTNNITVSAFNTTVAYNTTTPLAIREIDAVAQAGGRDDEFTLVRQGNTTVYLSKQQLAHQTRNNSGLVITPLAALASNGTTAVHGNVNPVRISYNMSTFGVDYYLSVFHVVSEDAAQNYATYAFGFCGSPPFEISAVSTRLPLNTTLSVGATNSTACGDAPFAFVSGLTLSDCTVTGTSSSTSTSTEACLKLSYGVCDAESRVAEFRVKDLENTFQITGTC